jgi:Ca2+-binding RTX toxin-like protein
MESIGRKVLLVVATLALLVAPGVSGIAAASTCLWDPGTGALSITVDESASLRVSASVILLEGSPCDAGATTATVDLIEIDGTAVANAVVLDHEGGAFGPGAEVEEPGSASEIEIVIALGGGNDQLIVNGGASSEDFSLGTGGANLNADDDVDVTLAGTEFVQLLGQGGNDTLSAAGSAVVGVGFSGDLIVGGGSGIDTITGGPTGDELFGGDDADFLMGLGGVDNLVGAAGSDILIGGPLRDTIDGGPGADTADYSGAPAGVSVDLAGAVSGGAGADDLTAVEHVIGSRFADTLTGNSIANELFGRGGNDVINGRGGSDAMEGEGGTRDVVSFAGAPSAITASLTAATASGWGADTLFGFEDVTGSARADVLSGSAGANTIKSGAGADRVGGGGGLDRLIGASGADRLNGGESHDRLEGGDGPDVLHGNAGNDALLGGPGIDTCFQDGGSGTKASCERP